MGYNTKFSLLLYETVTYEGPTPDTVKKLKLNDERVDLMLNTLGSHNEVNILLSDGAQTWMWYGHDEDMTSFSKQHPSFIFKLTGNGEDEGDIWCKYYQDGKYQMAKARIAYDKFDPAKVIH